MFHAPKFEASAEAIGAALLDGYRYHVTHAHEAADFIHQALRPIFDIKALALHAAELTRKARLRTIASLVVYSAVQSDEYYTALVVPRFAYTHMPLEARDQWIATMGQLKESRGIDLARDGSPTLSAGMRSILRNDPDKEILLSLLAPLTCRVSMKSSVLSTPMSSRAKAPTRMQA